MQPDHMPAKRTGAVVILSVHIIGDGSADGHKLSARRDWKEPACWNRDFQNIAERDARFTPETSRLFVEAENTVQSGAIKKCPTFVEARVAIASAKPIWETTRNVYLVQDAGYLIRPVCFVDCAAAKVRISTP